MIGKLAIGGLALAAALTVGSGTAGASALGQHLLVREDLSLNFEKYKTTVHSVSPLPGGGCAVRLMGVDVWEHASVTDATRTIVGSAEYFGNAACSAIKPGMKGEATVYQAAGQPNKVLIALLLP
jgi:hypothetical protein